MIFTGTALTDSEGANAGPGNAENADVTVDTALPADGYETATYGGQKRN